ncbi:MAG TPA: S1C family serine protease [Candidatus Magasanikbacteria bacterium]|nr:S1C family serine protease [Candidatus Magasanikbacteria bacterium]
MTNNNKKLPPHLPPPSCNIDLFHKLEKIKLVLYAALVALVAGVAGALSAFAWLTPDFYTIQGAWQAGGVRSAGGGELDPVYVRQVRQKLLAVYDTRRLPGNFLVDSARVAEAVFLSSDGWAAAYHPTYVAGEERNWEIIGDQGEVLHTSNVVYDKISKIIFFKVQGQGFRFAAVADWRNLDRSRELGVFERKKDFSARLAERKYIGDGRAFSAYIPQYADLLNVSALPGACIFDSNGNLLGFVIGGGQVLPGSVVDFSLSQILSGKNSINSVFVWRGLFVTGEKANGAAREVGGFLLTEIPPLGSVLKKGDLITAIGGRELVEEFLAWDTLLASDPAEVTVLRGGKQEVLSVKKNILP